MSSVNAASAASLLSLGNPTVNASNGQSTSSVSSIPTGKKHHHGGGGSFLSKLQSAVSSALSSGGESGEDANTTITNAIAAFLKQGNASSTGAGGTTTTSTTSTAGQTFAQLLSAHGVTEQSFGADLQAAFQQAEGTSAGASNAVGNLLDVEA